MRISWCLSAVFFLFVTSVQADTIVIVNSSNSDVLSKNDIKRIFLGRQSRFSDGTKIQPIYLPAGHKARKEFNRRVLKKSDKQLKRYWSSVSFSGKASMPEELDSIAKVVEVVAKIPGAIGYIDDTNIDIKTVKVVTNLN